MNKLRSFSTVNFIAALVFCLTFPCFLPEIRAMNKEEQELHDAASEGALSPILRLLKQRVNVNASDDQGYTALHAAVYGGHLGIVRYLVEGGASVNAVAKDGTTPLDIAVQNQSLSIVEYLLENAALPNLTRSDGANALHLAVTEGDYDIIKTLVKYKSNVNAQMRNGATPLHIASRLGRLSIVKFLIDQDATPNIHDFNTGATPLHIAIAAGYLDVAYYLIEHKADINAKDARGLTPLHFAALTGQDFAVKYLIEQGADVSVLNREGQTAQQVAENEGRKDIALYLASMTRMPLVAAAEQTRTTDRTDTKQEDPKNKETQTVTVPKIAEDEKTESGEKTAKSEPEKSEGKSTDKNAETQSWQHFYFPETQVRMPAPKGWFARNETRSLKTAEEDSGTVSIGKLYVTKEAIGQRRNEQDPGFKSGVVFYPNYQYIANMSYADTESFANSVIPGFFAQFKQIKGRTESALRTPLGQFRLFEADVDIGHHDFHYVYGFCKNENGHLIFMIQTPSKDWEENQPFFFNLVSQITLSAQVHTDDEIVTSVFDQSAE